MSQITNFKAFKHVEGSDYDRNIMERKFSGRLTKKRYKILNRICRVNSFSTHCGHEWDCCGCLCRQSVEFTYSRNLVTIQLTQSFNY